MEGENTILDPGYAKPVDYHRTHSVALKTSAGSRVLHSSMRLRSKGVQAVLALCLGKSEDVSGIIRAAVSFEWLRHKCLCFLPCSAHYMSFGRAHLAHRKSLNIHKSTKAATAPGATRRGEFAELVTLKLSLIAHASLLRGLLTHVLLFHPRY